MLEPLGQNRAQIGHFYIPIERFLNRTSLEIGNVPLLRALPQKIMLPLNKGNNHWVAIAIVLDKSEKNAIDIRISYTDSYDNKVNPNQLDLAIKNELKRIEDVFRTKYRGKPIVRAIQKVNNDEAKALVNGLLAHENQKDECEFCHRLISEIIGARQYDQDNNEIFIYLANAYKYLADAMDRLKEVEFTDLTLPEQVLEAHLNLLNGAIARNTASAMRQLVLLSMIFCQSF